MPPVVSTSNEPGVGELDDRLGDERAVIRDDPSRDVEPLLAKKLLERVAARVLAHARLDAVGDGEHRRVQIGLLRLLEQPHVSTTIPLSTAFAMS